MIRTASEADWADIALIYNHAVDEKYATADTEHITIESRLEWFREHSAEKYPIFVSEMNSVIAGWCSLSPYRLGRCALRSVAEISYYVHRDYRRQGVAARLISHALTAAPALGFRNLIAILLDMNQPSIYLLEKYGFSRWGHFPDIAVFSDRTCGQYVYGKKL